MTNLMCNRSAFGHRSVSFCDTENWKFVGELGINLYRRGRVSRPTEFVDAYGAGRETRPLQCRFGWPVKFQFVVLLSHADNHPLFQSPRSGTSSYISYLISHYILYLIFHSCPLSAVKSPFLSRASASNFHPFFPPFFYTVFTGRIRKKSL